jgi:hypothetical protein
VQLSLCIGFVPVTGLYDKRTWLGISMATFAKELDVHELMTYSKFSISSFCRPNDHGSGTSYAGALFPYRQLPTYTNRICDSSWNINRAECQTWGFVAGELERRETSRSECNQW